MNEICEASIINWHLLYSSRCIWNFFLRGIN